MKISWPALPDLASTLSTVRRWKMLWLAFVHFALLIANTMWLLLEMSFGMLGLAARQKITQSFTSLWRQEIT
jgi:hypothetical protein